MNEIRIDTDLDRYLPTWYKEVAEYKELMRVESGQADLMLSSLKRVRDNFYFMHMDASAISEWENVLNIIPDLSIETIEFRRTRLLNRLSTKPPFSVRLLREKLDMFIGSGGYTLVVDGKNFTIYVEASSSDYSYAIEVSYTINSIKPAHIVYVLMPYSVNDVLMSEVIKKTDFSYNYNLGGWALGVLPFASEGQEGEIKMAQTPSLKPEFLNDTAQSAMDNIAKVRLNGSIVKTDLTKTRAGNVVTVTYPVTVSETNLVSKIEFLDSGNNVLTATDIYVPIAQSTTMKHIINVKEGVI